jgi:hypothetical protein
MYFAGAINSWMTLHGTVPGLFSTLECELVAALSLQPLEAALEDRANSIVRSGVNWERTFVIAEHWEVEPVFFSTLAQLSAVPSTIAEHARTRATRARSRSIAGALWTSNLINRIEAQGAPCILLKGAAIGALAYGDPSFRTFADADILIADNDLHRVSAMLETWGFQPIFSKADVDSLVSNGHALEFINGSQKVEIHVALLSGHLSLDIPVDDLWTSAVSIVVAGQKVLTLDRINSFIYLCAHGAKHEWQRFRWVCDVSQLGSKLTEEEARRVEEIARRIHMRRIILLATEIAHALTGSDMRALRSRNFGNRADIASLITRAARQFEDLSSKPPRPGQEDFQSRFAGLMYWMRARERLRDRFRVATRAFFAPIRTTAPQIPLSILRRSARLVSLAIRRSPS